MTIAVAFVVGAFSWSFFEYVIHRWLGHDRRFRGNAFGVEHIRHHIEGDYFAPTWKKLLAAAIAAAILAVPAILVAGTTIGLAFVAGLVGCFGVYEWHHRRDHTHAPYGRWARRHHFHHHLVDARVNFGVTSPLWDLVFGTYRTTSQIKVPPRLAMVWLIDPGTGAVRAEHADTFVLGSSRR